MAGNGQDFLALWRRVAVATVTFLIAFTVLIDNLGRLFVNPEFHVSEVIFGTLMASWTALLGIDVWQRVRRNGNGKPNGGGQ